MSSCQVQGCNRPSFSYKTLYSPSSHRSESVAYRPEHGHTHSAPLNSEPNRLANFWQRAKEIFTLKRLAIVASVMGASSLLGKGLDDFLDKHSPGNHKHDHGSPVSLALYFGQLAFASSLGIFLDALWIGKMKFKASLGKVFSANSLKLILGLAAFNTLLEALINKASQKAGKDKSPLVELMGALVKITGTFGLARYIGGAGNSLTALLSASCPCCGFAVCMPELVTFVSSLANLASNFFKKSGSTSSLVEAR